MKATTKPEDVVIGVGSASDRATEITPRRTLRTSLTAFLWRNPSYLSAWIDGAICGALLFVIAKTLLEGK